MINTIKQSGEWITLNLVNTVYLVKEWLLLQIGITAVHDSWMDDFVKWGVGITIIAFNIVRIIKYCIEIKERKK